MIDADAMDDSHTHTYIVTHTLVNKRKKNNSLKKRDSDILIQTGWYVSVILICQSLHATRMQYTHLYFIYNIPEKKIEFHFL